MTVSYVGVSHNTGPADVPAVTGRTAGDLLILALAAESAPTPVGWSKIYGTLGSSALTIFSRTATGDTADNASKSGASNAGVMLAYRDAIFDVVGGQESPGDSVITAPAVTAAASASTVARFFWVDNFSGLHTLTSPNGFTTRLYSGGLANYPLLRVGEHPRSGAVGVLSATASVSNSANAGVTITLRSANVAPIAPTPLAPANNSTIPSNATNRFQWEFADPDPGDSQSAYNIRHRPVGTVEWVSTGWVALPNAYHDFPAGTFADGDHEWQVATKDAQGVEGPYSVSWFFAAATPGEGPTIVDPANGSTVPSNTYEATVSYPTWDSAEWEVIDATSSAVIDSGTLGIADRTFTAEGLVDGSTVIWRVRATVDTLPTAWAESTTDVSYTPPPAPSLEVATSDEQALISVMVTTPAPSGGAPAAQHVDIYSRDPSGRDKYRPAEGVKIAAGKAPNATWLDWTAAARTNYEYRAVAVASNGTTTSSEWTPINPTAEPTIYYGGGYGD